MNSAEGTFKMNPLDLADKVKERYQRYLKTMFYFRDRDLRESFAQALSSGHLSQGPFLEATPIFKKGDTPRALFTRLLGSTPDEGFLQALEGDRPLHQHQHRAIERVDQGRNVIVATGTGSGKTEAFLYPILLHLYREHQAGKLGAGVRALVLYPMNALANDQRDRLNAICTKLVEAQSPFRFTFGQYIGETPEGEKRVRRDLFQVSGELKTRTEIRETPPHILLTNYSMLEYLLIRPLDSLLFDDGRARWWTFLVLDEAHLYRGARGIEMGMLIRRLKQRLREGGCAGEFRCIATSATLVGKEKDRQAVAQFASDLFGEPFAEEDVILGDTEEIEQSSSVRLLPNDYAILAQANRQSIEQVARKVGVNFTANESVDQVIRKTLQADQRAAELRRRITNNPLDVRQVADEIFGDTQPDARVSGLTTLVELLAMTKDPLTHPPLLSTRYHLFLRSLEGAYIQFLPQKRILLEKNQGDPSAAIFEIALCRECGQHYLVAQKDFKGGKVMEAIRDPSHNQFGATFLRPIEGDDKANEDEEDTQPPEIYQLCVRCGKAAKDKPDCGHDDVIRVVKEPAHDSDDKSDQIKRCGACGYNAAGHDPVREIVHGTDGPHSVIATTLFQYLDPERKKVLAFADGRQEAAFFAWYLDKSYRDILSRNLFLRIAKSFEDFPAGGIALATIADRALLKFRDAFIESESDDEPTIRKNIWRALYREFLTEERRISLEGVGLIRWSIEFPRWFEVPKVLLQPPWSLTEAEARDLIMLLLDTMRARYAVELKCKGDVTLSWQDLDLGRTQMRFRIGDPARVKDIVSWNGKQGGRAKLLGKIAQGRVDDAHIDAALREIWQALTLEDDILERIDDARRLNPNWWRLQLIAEDEKIFKCDVCGQIQTISVRGVCTRHGCPGTLRETSRCTLEPDHYRALYEDDLPGPLVTEEHTAQLDHTKAREFQQRFKDGKIHMLSCSTTFELGVDLGDLDTAFLRNVPPESFNYAQRVGRVARRLGRPGFVVTYCRRNPHDLYHFNNPNRMLRGETRPPTLALRNEKIISRHIAAFALSAFFRTYPHRFGTVEKFFGDLAHPSSVTDLQQFLRQHRFNLEASLQNIVPPEVASHVGLNDGSWIEKIAGAESRLAQAEIEMSSDYTSVVQVREQAAQRYDAQPMQWANQRLKTIAEEDTLSFLSRKSVIPKYGFPVDVVELDTHRTSNAESSAVSLERDLSIAIAEFAPSSELVANKKLWKSYGLKKVIGKEWERYWYVRCATCARFERKRYVQGESKPSFEKCSCGQKSVPLEYVEPRFGFVTENVRPKNPTARPVRVFTTRPYFVGFQDGKDKKDTPLNAVVSVTPVSPGIMVVVCEGRGGKGFYICDKCGAGFQNKKQFTKGHKTPYGQDCSARPDTLRQVMLGHELLTDVLKLQFQLPPPNTTDLTWLAFALAYALLEGAAETLDVPATDLSATVAYARGQAIPPIVLFDNVPGGAGLVAQLQDQVALRHCLEAARERVSGKCGCREEESCYGCLRNYRNQFAHSYLKRGAALKYIDLVLEQWH